MKIIHNNFVKIHVFFINFTNIYMTSNKLKNILINEQDRQQNSLELVASENYVSQNVMNACANVFTNKYSE